MNIAQLDTNKFKSSVLCDLEKERVFEEFDKGLKKNRFDVDQLEQRLGKDFKLLNSKTYKRLNKNNGDRIYVRMSVFTLDGNKHHLLVSKGISNKKINKNNLFDVTKEFSESFSK